MPKVWKRLIMIVSILAVLVGLFFLAAYHGWRLFGFKACLDPERIEIKEVTIQEDGIHISCRVPIFSLPTCYNGYTKKLQGDTLYIGIRLQPFFYLTTEQNIDLDISLDEPVQRIVLTNGDQEVEINPHYGKLKECLDPDWLSVRELSVQEDAVRLTGEIDPEHETYFAGYTRMVWENTLYVGIRGAHVVNEKTDTGDFELDISLKRPIQRIVLTNGDKEIVIYPEEDT